MILSTPNGNQVEVVSIDNTGVAIINDVTDTSGTYPKFGEMQSPDGSIWSILVNNDLSQVTEKVSECLQLFSCEEIRAILKALHQSMVTGIGGRVRYKIDDMEKELQVGKYGGDIKVTIKYFIELAKLYGCCGYEEIEKAISNSSSSPKWQVGYRAGYNTRTSGI